MKHFGAHRNTITAVWGGCLIRALSRSCCHEPRCGGMSSMVETDPSVDGGVGE